MNRILASGKTTRSPCFCQVWALGGLTGVRFPLHSAATDDPGKFMTYATDRYILVFSALFLEAMVGRMARIFRIVPHPNALPGRLAVFLADRLDVAYRGS